MSDNLTLDIRAPEYRADPYRFFRTLRAERPVCRIAPHGHWAVFRHADVQAALRDPRRFSSAGIGPVPGSGPRFFLETRGLIGTDPPEHTRLRALVSRAFSPQAVRTMETRVRGVARELLSPWREAAGFELIEAFSMPLPMILLSDLLGIDAARRDDFKAWTQTMLTWRNAAFITDPAAKLAREREIEAQTAAISAYFTGVIEARRLAPRGDMISGLLRAAVDGETLTPLDVLSFVRVLLTAGTEAATNLIGNGILALQAFPGIAARVRQDLSLVPAFVEELLRHSGPVLALIRRASEDCIIAGTRIAEGELVLPMVASANHDEAVFPSPESFILDRNPNPHLGFGGSVHFCLGAAFARLQARVAFEELLSTFTRLDRATDAPLEYLDSFFFRGVKKLALLTA